MSSPPSNPSAPQAANGPVPWRKLNSEAGPSLLIAQARFDTVVNPRNEAELRRLVLDVAPWVNVVALDPEGRSVCVRQWRFGTESVTTEIPGGVVERGEDPLAAARRELREETGYTSEDWTPLGVVEPNPAFQNNLCYHYLARDARLTHPTEPDIGEDIQVVLLDTEQILEGIRSGSIRHSLVVSALCRVLDLRSHPW